MKILIAADGSTYTKRMLAFIAAHDEWLGPQCGRHKAVAPWIGDSLLPGSVTSLWTGD
jgi:hypothetical protein